MGYRHQKGLDKEGGVGIGSYRRDIGLFAGWHPASGQVLFRIGKRKDDYQYLINGIFHSVVIPVQN
jgi:hypothetical protein